MIQRGFVIILFLFYSGIFRICFTFFICQGSILQAAVFLL